MPQKGMKLEQSIQLKFKYILPEEGWGVQWLKCNEYGNKDEEESLYFQGMQSSHET